MVLALAVAVGAVLAGTGTLMLLPLLSVLSSGSTYEALSSVPCTKLVNPAPLSAASKMPVLAPVWVSVKAVPLTVAVMVLEAVALASSRSVTRKKALAPCA